MFSFDETFWVAVSIILICIVMFKYAKEPLKNFLNDRSAKISYKISEAMSLLGEAEKMLKEQRALYQSFNKQSKDMLTSAEMEIAELTSRSKAAFNEWLDHKNTIISKAIRDKESGLVRNLRTQAVQLAISTCVNTLRGEENGTKLQSKLLSDAIQNITSSQSS